MNFKRKATILLVAVSLVGTLSISIAYTRKNAIMNEQLAIDSNSNTFSIIRGLLADRLNAAAKYYHAFNAENIRKYFVVFTEVYQQQGIYFQLDNGQDILYSTFADPTTAEPSQDSPTFFVHQGIHYLAIQQQLNLDDGQSFVLTVFWNTQNLRSNQKAMMRFASVVSVLSISLIGIIGFILMQRLTKPFDDLGNAARRFADGEYNERVSVHTKDEIGRFAQTYNLMADAIEQQIHEMDDLVRDREQFIDHLSHEIRTPITAMIGYSQALMHSKATEADKQKAAEYIGQQCMRLKLLSEKLLGLSRLRYDTVELQPINLRSILHAALKTLNRQLLVKNIHVENDIPDTQVLGDAVLLETLFQNLIENAIHASTQDATIELIGTVRDKVLTVTVKDNGIGISEENLIKITEPFMCVDAARSRLHGGIGIGLALCKRICDIHHTTLDITSVPGKGTKIKVDFTIP